MTIPISVDLVSAFLTLITRLKPYAKAQGVTIGFKSEIKELESFHILVENISQFSLVITKLIDYTPQLQHIEVLLQYNPKALNILIVNISNTGINLARIREITNKVEYDFDVVGFKNSGTTFIAKIELDQRNNTLYHDDRKNNLGYTPYFKEIENKLSDHFKEIENLQTVADNKGEKEGVFLRKLNTVIESRMENNEFKVSDLASAMALSRAQLFRKMKALTKMPPSEYLLYFRLLVAKDLLKTKSEIYNIGEIGYKVGFISKSHFTRSFQKQFGICPSNYKKQEMQQ